jgi:hypothetical protein
MDVDEFLRNRDPVADWKRCSGYLEAALELAGTHTLADVVQGIADGVFHFWPGEKCAAVTQVYTYPTARYLHIFLAGGDLEELLAMVPLFKSWAKHLGCTELTVAGRPGWERKLGGWTRRAVVLSTRVEDISS